MESRPEIQILAFADSEVANATFSEGRIHILFSAAHVSRRSQDDTGKSLEGYARGVELILFVAKTKIETDELIGRIATGRVMMESQWSSNIPLPYTITMPVKLELALANQVQAEIEAAGLECRFTGEPNFFESMAC